MAHYPLAMDALELACQSRAKVRKNMIHDAPASVQQELMLAAMLSPASVSLEKAKEALKVAPKW